MKKRDYLRFIIRDAVTEKKPHSAFEKDVYEETESSFISESWMSRKKKSSCRKSTDLKGIECSSSSCFGELKFSCHVLI